VEVHRTFTCRVDRLMLRCRRYISHRLRRRGRRRLVCGVAVAHSGRVAVRLERCRCVDHGLTPRPRDAGLVGASYRRAGSRRRPVKARCSRYRTTAAVRLHRSLHACSHKTHTHTRRSLYLQSWRNLAIDPIISH